MTATQIAETPHKLTDTAFKRELTLVLPQLRAFARSLCGDRDLADDLVQETMLKSWSARGRFITGTNFRAWTFTILRNHYFSLSRRSKFVGAWDDLVADRLLAAPAEQLKIVELSDVVRALAQVPVPQREALILVGAGGFSYEEAATIMGTAIGTVKSRVARARTALEALINDGQLAQSRSEFEADENVTNLFSVIDAIEDRQPAAEPGEAMTRLVA
ncbi:sigma-70 family RNA polymerase sigma factor [Sphingobium yanoikuyae]|uniref:sigma-70 family RNA polymerase sigma factor n=1 Tax=Sphingobium yanoikuyae TaxID=13690 RepID=UPI00345E6D88